MATAKPVIHGRDHGVGGADPIYHMWEITGGGGGPPPRQRVLLAVFDGSGASLHAGMQGDVSVPFASTITGWVLLADVTGSLELDIWKDTFASYPPTSGDSITASAKPTLSSADHAEDSTLAGWTTAVSAGDTLRFNIDSVSAITRATLALTMEA